MKNAVVLTDKYEKLHSELGGSGTFYMEDVRKLFPELQKSTLYWYMSKLVDAGFIRRIRNGVFAFNDWREKNPLTVSAAGEEITELLIETGFDFYLSGLDVLQRFMQHVPESYPNLLFIQKGTAEEILPVLRDRGYSIIPGAKTSELLELIPESSTGRIIYYETENFGDSKNEIATIEKAFVDLYYAVTRDGYPLSLQELVRIYENMVRLGAVDRKKLIAAASRRSLQHDIRYITESKYITNEARQFVDILQREEIDGNNR